MVSLRSLNDRNDTIRQAMVLWNKDSPCIEHEKDNGRRFAVLLREAVEKGVYDPSVVGNYRKITADESANSAVDKE